MVIAPGFNGLVHRNMCVCVAQGLMREVVAVLPDEAAGEGRSLLLQVRRLRRRRSVVYLRGQGAIPIVPPSPPPLFTSLVSIILLLL
jgi:hypothetical protein